MSSDDSRKLSSLLPPKPGEQVIEIHEDLNHDGVIDNEDLLEALRIKKNEDLRDALKYDENDDRSKAEQAITAMMTLELAYQKNIEVQGDSIIVPGRVSITPISLLQTLFAVIMFAAWLIHFAVMSPNFLLSVFVILIIQIGGIMIYYTACLSQRSVVQVLQLLWTIVLTVLVDWAYIDQILHPIRANMRYGLLVVGLVAFNMIPLLMMLHFVWLGRGKRKVTIKNKKKKSS